MEIAINILDTILFIILGFSVLYLFVFSVLSLKKWNVKYPVSDTHYKIAVFIPAYKEDSVIEKSIRALILQDYPREHFDIVVISDQMGDQVNGRLAKMPLILLTPQFEKSSKAASLNFAVDYLASVSKKYDIVTVLDADNIVEPEYLQDICNAYDQNIVAMQCHRVAKNRDTEVAVLDAVSEEINNSIFRKGHVNAGLSSALIGSGMAFDYKWFAENIKLVFTAGEDKEIEKLLLKQGIYIDYLNDTLVYDEKVSRAGAFYSQRRRWIAAQFDVFALAVRDLPRAVWSGNIDYCDKLFQWAMLPRVVLLGLIALIALGVFFWDWQSSLKWWILLLMLLFSLAFATPDYLVDKRFKKALRRIPLIGLMMTVNLFRTKNVNNHFIHTKHTV